MYSGFKNWKDMALVYGFIIVSFYGLYKISTIEIKDISYRTCCSLYPIPVVPLSLEAKVFSFTNEKNIERVINP